MDETRALLDALMGPNRNSKPQANSKRGGPPDFADRNVCKNFLVGFCPHDWFTTAKRQLKPCHKIHSEVMREQFEAHPDTDRYRAEYEEDFLNYLEVVARDCDAYIARERPKCRAKGSGGKVVRLPPDLKKRCEEMEVRYAELIKTSETLADQSLALSQAQMKQAIALKEEMDDIKQKYTSEFPGEDLCEICGVKYLCGGGALQWHDEEDHKRGKTHDGFAKIRAKLVELRGRRRSWEKHREDIDRGRAADRERERERERHERDKEREREREKARRQEEERELQRERQREWEREQREKERLRQQQERERELRRQRSRSNSIGSRRGRADKGRSRADRDKKRDRSRSRQSDNKVRQQQGTEEDLPALWARLGTLSPEQRAEAVKALPQDMKDRLEEWLVARISAQRAASGADDADDSDSSLTS
mmetsp:Transcript_14605/g.28758  ORF Transcript_14605/g.28758 Transcript_14605/m.28758 type:complete len:422 (-) Transcript_14605:58-1323(-)|eukprot:CAMPEP_0172716924 /NCGR_PEP_ID=MMETSP1074-20121228/69779_1 /TAXON_ID=2916 /ORGANISM="Ceratium fusus, Strain PA161109" /LENGTH=421 /DNA_ID=CAMNT_0013541737 /DNA_START=111 /DNA_END=1376 /DNA_ORIENTATION=-